MKTKVYKNIRWLKQLVLMSAMVLMATAGFAQENLSISMTGDSDVEPGDDLIYTITYSNTGDQIAHDVEITLQLPTTPDYYTFVEASPDGNYDEATNTVTWNKGFIPQLELMGAGPYVIHVRIRAGVRGTKYGYSSSGFYMPNVGITEFSSVVSIVSTGTTTPETSEVKTWVTQISDTEVTDVNGIIKSATGALTYHLVKVENRGNIYDNFSLFINQHPDSIRGYDCYPNLDGDKDFQPLDGTIIDLNNQNVAATDWLGPGESKYFFVKKESPSGTNPSSGSGDKWNCMDIIAQSIVSGQQDDGRTQTLIVGNVNEPLITLTKIAAPDPVQRGGVVDYTIYIFNSNDKSSAVATNPILTDFFPEGASYIEGSATYEVGIGNGLSEPVSFSYNETEGTATWGLDPIFDGPINAITVKFKVLVDAEGDCTGSLTNNASLTFDGLTSPITASITSGIVSHPDLVITKESVKKEAVPGESVTYTLTYSNEGTCPVENVEIFDSFDAGKLSYVSNTGNGVVDGNEITFDLASIDPASGGTLYPGDQGSFNVTLAVKSAANFTVGGTYLLNNTAIIDGADTGTTEIDEFNNTSSWAIAVKILPDLKIEKTVFPALEPGMESTYTLAITNEGDKPAVNVVVKDLLPVGLTVGAISDGGVNTSGIITWPTIPSFAVGDEVNYTVTVTPECSAIGSITNRAEVWSDTPDKDELNNVVDLESALADNTSPVVSAAAGSSTVNCLANALEPADIPTALDNCDGIIVGVLEGYVDNPDPISCEGTRVYTYSYSDGAGNVSYWTYTYTIDVIDFTMPADEGSTVACISEATEPTPPEVNDHCGNLIIPSGPVEGGSYVDCEGTVTYTWTYEDCAGNSHDWVYTYRIEVEDFTMPENDGSIVACVSEATEPIPPSVNDNCGNPITPSGPVEGGSYDGCEGTVTYTWTYEDCVGNSHDWVYTYTIEREDFTMPANVTETIACVDDVVPPTPPVVYDACGNPITPVAGATPATPACNGEMVYTWTYTDCEGNTHDWTHTIIISAPVVIMPANVVEVVTDPDNAGMAEPVPPIVVDNCGRELLVSSGVATGNNDCFGARIWTFTYTDCSGKTYKWTHTYAKEQPIVEMPANEASTVNCAIDATKPTPPVVSDSNGLLLDVSEGVRSTDPACEGDITWTFTYLDCVGNAYDWVYTYTVDIPDFAANMPADGSSTVDCLADAQVQPIPPAVNDYCGNPITPTLVTTPDAIACTGDMVWVFNYEDCAGNNHD
ncbi:HYR-like domain-containing protein, partial [Sunxiuqinia sp. sy24]|uniref:HYR-like domain-containing protein n=1 Tax=Sunxiuqinia sp. sy24 TaxID=3461495 RepID=UPI004045BBA0